MRTDVAVIGGGAAGMMAAITAADNGRDVTLLEPNEKLGKKLYITGKGRCNFTNNCGVEEALEGIPRNRRFMYSSLYGFSPADTMAWFESCGLRLKTERGQRVFPASDKSSDVISVLTRRLERLGVSVLRKRVTEIEVSTEGLTVGFDRGEILCGSAVIATGGLSYPLTGSTGDGYRFARRLGHSIIEPVPSLVPLECEGEDCGLMQGLSLRNVGLRVLDDGGKTVYEDFGELLFTHYGISGPMALSASAHMRDYKSRKYRAVIDLKPALDGKTLDQRILRDFEELANRDFQNALGKLVNRVMIPVIVNRSGIPPETKVNSVTREQRRRLLELLKGFELEISGPRPIDEAVVSSGGVDVKEINPATMESRLVPGLYFAGEVIDVDAYTGGFNLQIAWSTGYAAGKNA